MKKYIQRNEAGVPGKRWHSNPKCLTIRPDNVVVEAPDSMLKAYGITQKCEMCTKREEHAKLIDKEEDLRQYHSLLVVTSTVVGVQMERSWLRDELSRRDIYYNLRESKSRLARKLCRCWLREKDLSDALLITDAASAHWAHRIEVNDRHRPEYYQEMLKRSLRAMELVQSTAEAFRM